MEQEMKTTLEAPSEKSEDQDASQVDPCRRARLEAEVADCKPVASGLSLRSTTSKC
jgi:hypothetical protein